MAATLINTDLPDFKLQAFVDGDFKEITQDDFKGKWNILFFYPADFTFVCPTELGDMADKYATFKEMGSHFNSSLSERSFTKRGRWYLSKTCKQCWMTRCFVSSRSSSDVTISHATS